MAGRYFELNRAEETTLLKKQNGQGGFQTFMRRLQSQYRRGTKELQVTELIVRISGIAPT